MEEPLGTEPSDSLILTGVLLLSVSGFLLWASASSVALGLASDALGQEGRQCEFLFSADELKTAGRRTGGDRPALGPMDLPPQLAFALYVSAFALGFPLNLLAIRGAVSHAKLRLTPSLVYTLHLGCSDLLLAITLPLKAVEALASGAWPLPLPFCPVFALAHFAPLYAGGGFLAALSAGRYLGAAFPFGYQAIRRPRYSWCVCVAIWALVLCHLGLALALEAPGGWLDNTTSSLGINIPVNGSPVCLEAWDPDSARPARLSFSILLFFLPLVITAFCYVGCLRALVHSGLSHKRKVRAAWVAGGALLTLVLCLGPYNASNVAGFINPDLGGSWRKLGLITGAWSVVLNPLVTGYLGTGPGRGTICVTRTQRGTIQK